MPGKVLDVSSNNGTIDWNKAANDGVTDVIIRLSLDMARKTNLQKATRQVHKQPVSMLVIII